MSGIMIEYSSRIKDEDEARSSCHCRSIPHPSDYEERNLDFDILGRCGTLL